MFMAFVSRKKFFHNKTRWGTSMSLFRDERVIVRFCWFTGRNMISFFEVQEIRKNGFWNSKVVQ